MIVAPVLQAWEVVQSGNHQRICAAETEGCTSRDVSDPFLLLVEELLHALCDYREAEDRIDVGSLLGVDAEHAFEEAVDILTEMAGDVVVLTNYDFPGQLMETLSIEWRLQSTHLIQKHAQGPNIRLKTIWFRLNNLRRQVIWSTNYCLRF